MGWLGSEGLKGPLASPATGPVLSAGKPALRNSCDGATSFLLLDKTCMQLCQTQMQTRANKVLQDSPSHRSPGRPAVRLTLEGDSGPPPVPLTLTPRHPPRLLPKTHTHTHTHAKQIQAQLHPAHTQRPFVSSCTLTSMVSSIVLETRVNSSSTSYRDSSPAQLFLAPAPYSACSLMSHFLPKFSLFYFCP